jgi:hypothetical protein
MDEKNGAEDSKDLSNGEGNILEAKLVVGMSCDKKENVLGLPSLVRGY